MAIKEPAYISLERTVCFGDCPIYKLLLLPNGKVSISTQNKMYHAVTDTTAVSNLFSSADYHHFWKFKDNYSSFEDCQVYLTDFPSLIITVKTGNQKKTTNLYLGCRDTLSALKWLYEYGQAIDSIAGTKRFVSLEGGPMATTVLRRPDSLQSRK
jgi:hypothetical protein